MLLLLSQQPIVCDSLGSATVFALICIYNRNRTLTSAVTHLSCLTPFHRGRAHTRHSKDNNLSQAREVASRLAVRVCGTVTGRWPARFDPESAGLGDDQNLGLAWTANLGPIFLVTLSITGPCGAERLSPRPGVRVGLPKAQVATLGRCICPGPTEDQCEL